MLPLPSPVHRSQFVQQVQIGEDGVEKLLRSWPERYSDAPEHFMVRWNLLQPPMSCSYDSNELPAHHVTSVNALLRSQNTPSRDRQTDSCCQAAGAGNDRAHTCWCTADHPPAATVRGTGRDCAAPSRGVHLCNAVLTAAPCPVMCLGQRCDGVLSVGHCCPLVNAALWLRLC